jgi:hypothetical protein
MVLGPISPCGPDPTPSILAESIESRKGSTMKSKLVRIAAVLGVVSALATAAAPAGAAVKKGGTGVEPPWGQFCTNSYGVMCIPTPGPFAL